jgi:hypothetical protein
MTSLEFGLTFSRSQILWIKATLPTFLSNFQPQLSFSASASTLISQVQRTVDGPREESSCGSVSYHQLFWGDMTLWNFYYPQRKTFL